MQGAGPCREPSRGFGAMGLARGAAVPPLHHVGRGHRARPWSITPLWHSFPVHPPAPGHVPALCITLGCLGVTLEGRIPEALLKLLHLFNGIFSEAGAEPDAFNRGRAGDAHSPHRAQTLPQGHLHPAVPCRRGQSRGVPAGCREGKGRILAVPLPPRGCSRAHRGRNP